MKYPTTNPTLLERVQNGDEISWNEFYHRYAPVVRCAGGFFNFTEEECDDLMQMVMLKFFGAAKRYTYREGEVKFRTYFARIVKSQAVDYIRRNARQRELRIDSGEADDPFEAAFMDEWRKAFFAEALDELRRRVDERTYQAFEMYGLQNRPAEQVAEVLEMSTAQLYVVKKRCTDILRGIVARYNRNDEELHLEF